MRWPFYSPPLPRARSSAVGFRVSTVSTYDAPLRLSPKLERKLKLKLKLKLNLKLKLKLFRVCWARSLLDEAVKLLFVFVARPSHISVSNSG